ncbi:MAG: hypothetical protein AAF404_17220 [Pseudomonadota bacterium]
MSNIVEKILWLLELLQQPGNHPMVARSLQSEKLNFMLVSKQRSIPFEWMLWITFDT